MAKQLEVKVGRVFMGRFGHGADIIESIESFCQKEKVELAQFTCIGAVQKAHVARYDQNEKKYNSIHFDQPLEMLSCNGNVSLKDGSLFVHAHVVFGDDQGHAFGGHLMKGTPLFVCEYFIRECLGNEALTRQFDEATGLGLWA